MNGIILLVIIRKVILNICCYHGTDKASLLSILSSGVFIVNRRSDHWLGNGAYFLLTTWKSRVVGRLSFWRK